MPRLTPLSSKELMRKLTKLGYEGPLPGGRHSHMVKNNQVIPIPIHGNKDVDVGLIQQILKEVDVDRDTWIGL